MGNCQAIDAAALVIQHPNGRLERMYWPVTAREIMRVNPGHYVSLIIPIPIQPKDDHDDENEGHDKKKIDARSVRFTRVKLLRPHDTLVLGHAYRLVTTQEVKKILKAKKNGMFKKNQIELSPEKPKTSVPNQDSACDEAKPSTISQLSNSNEVISQDKQRVRIATPLANVVSVVGGSRTWRPTLYRISEATY